MESYVSEITAIMPVDASTVEVLEHRVLPLDVLAEAWTRRPWTNARTKATYITGMRDFLFWCRTSGVDLPTREDIERYTVERAETVKAATLAAYMAGIRSFYSWASRVYPQFPNVADGVRCAPQRGAHASHKRDPLTGEQARRLLESIDRTTLDGMRDYAIVALMLTAGLRTVEVSRANIEDLSNDATSVVLYVQGKGRNDKAERVKIVPEVDAAIRDYLARRGECDGSAPLFASISNRNRNKRLTPQTIGKRVKGLLKAVGLSSDKLTAHSLRHTAATVMLLNGATLDEVQQVLRHASINTTKIYDHSISRAKNMAEMRTRAVYFAGTTA